MVFERVVKDGNGKRFKVTMSIAEGGPTLERAILEMGQKARSQSKQKASACGGLVQVFIEEVK